MTKSTNSKPVSNALEQEVSEIRKRLEWFDEERRRSVRKLAELEQRSELQERELAGEIGESRNRKNNCHK